MDSIQKQILDTIDKNRKDIIAFGNDIYCHAELGFKEVRTSSKFTEQLRKLGIENIQTELAITGVKGYLKSDTEGPTVALIGEMDALRIPTHKYANPETQGAHCCGHHAQLTGVIGAAYALTQAGIREALGGNIVFFAVPAEEYGEIEFKNQLKEQGKVKYGGGKAELIRIGAFDDIDLSVVHHSRNDGLISVGNSTSNGFVSKVIRYHGRAAHAAAAPHKGINALNAASLGLTALQYHRETFRDEDSVRIHPILTKGGDLVNVTPDEAVIETLVRANNIDAILDAARKTDRSFKAGADALGAGYTIETMPGYLPEIAQPAHPSVLAAAELAATGRNILKISKEDHRTGSTDVGDLEHIQPVLTFNTGGIAGDLHTVDFDMVDEEEAYITTAKIFALSAYELLKQNAASAKETVSQFKPKFNKQQYLAFMDSLISIETKGVVENE